MVVELAEVIGQLRASSTTQKIKLTPDPHRLGQPGVRPDVSGEEMPGDRG